LTKFDESTGFDYPGGELDEFDELYDEFDELDDEV
jgi:hypothetical protein